jgi:hypothetical protein
MNIEKIEKLRQYILEEPRRYNQTIFGARKGVYDYDYDKGFVAIQKPPCGTVACLAGNAILMEGQKLFVKRGGEFVVRNDASVLAAKILGLTPLQAAKLVRGVPGEKDWGLGFAAWFDTVRGYKEKAEVTTAFLAHLIKTNGECLGAK